MLADQWRASLAYLNARLTLSRAVRSTWPAELGLLPLRHRRTTIVSDVLYRRL